MCLDPRRVVGADRPLLCDLRPRTAAEEVAPGDFVGGHTLDAVLLLLAPHYIKVDIAIIRGIDSNIDKQQVVTDVVTYAHARQMQVVAEGIENEAELRTVLRLGVDLLQGYFLARPAAIPDPIAPAALKILKDAHFA